MRSTDAVTETCPDLPVEASNMPAHVLEMPSGKATTGFRPRWARLLVPLALFAITLLCYWPAIRGSFVWDDQNLIANNPWIKSPALGGEMFRHWLQPESNAPYYRPIQTVTLAIDYYIWGANPTGYHLTNIILHAAAGYLLYLLLTKLLLRHSLPLPKWQKVLPFAVACVWTVHPIHNAAVAYIAGRADTLGMIFAVAAWLISLRGFASRGLRANACFLGAAGLALLALLSKELSVVWLGLFAIYILSLRKDVMVRRKLAVLGGLLAIIGIWAWMRTLPVEAGASAQTVDTSWPQRAVLVTRAVGDYASLLVAPLELHMERSIWPDWNRHPISWLKVPGMLGVLGWCGVLTLGLVMIACFWKHEGRALRIIGAVWFTLCFLPISNLFPLNAQVAEHWIYVASIGALIFAAGCWVAIPERLNRLMVPLLTCWLAALAVRTAFRAAEWSDPVVFYQQTIAATGGTPRVFNNLGATLSSRGHLEDAERVYRYGLKRFPDQPALLSNLGTIMMKQGRRAEASEVLDAAGKSAEGGAPGDDRAKARSVAAQVRSLLMDKKATEALQLVQRLRQQLPERWDLLKLEAEALLETDGTAAAVAVVEAYAVKHWYSIDAQSMLARLSYREGDPQKASVYWQKAASLDVWASEPWSELAKIAAERKQIESACSYQQKVVDRVPRDPMPRLVLAKFLRDAGREMDAAVALVEARELSGSVNP